MSCSKLVLTERGKTVGAAHPCRLKVTFVDALGRSYCTRHAPSVEQQAVIEAIAAVRKPTTKEVK